MSQSRKPHRAMLDRLIADLQALPELKAKVGRAPKPRAGHTGPQARVSLRAAGHPVNVLVDVRKTVYPRDARELVWRMREAASQPSRRGRGDEVHAMVVAESISPGAKAMLAFERVGYYDGGGSLYLPAAGAYLFIEKPVPKPEARTMRSLFTGRRAQVLHAMLMQHRDWFGVKDLAGLTQVPPSTISPVLTELERQDWVQTRGQGPSKQRRLTDPAALLDAWVKHLSSSPPDETRRYFVPGAAAGASSGASDKTLEARLDQTFEAAQATYALSFEAAAQHYAPFLSSVSQLRVRMLDDAASTVALKKLGARPVGEGANLIAISAKSPGDLQFRERVEGVWLASPIQVYLDLVRADGRAKELAAHLRRERIGF